MVMYGILLSHLGWCPSCHLELLDKLKKRICRTVTASLAASLEPFSSSSKCGQVKSFLQLLLWQMFFRILEAVFSPFSQGRSPPYSNRLHDFSVTIPRCCKYVYVNSFFPRTDRLRNSLPIECSPLICNLNGFTSRINRHLLTASSF